mmetsp:Transcript_49936/g.108556  ORF Transcript_49936/g.108556 Transcript_49936/m.108556 type:complete len:222 (-) Transcript_49936:32-697(-)
MVPRLRRSGQCAAASHVQCGISALLLCAVGGMSLRVQRSGGRSDPDTEVEVEVFAGLAKRDVDNVVNLLAEDIQDVGNALRLPDVDSEVDIAADDLSKRLQDLRQAGHNAARLSNPGQDFEAEAQLDEPVEFVANSLQSTQQPATVKWVPSGNGTSMHTAQIICLLMVVFVIVVLFWRYCGSRFKEEANNYVTSIMAQPPAREDLHEVWCRDTSSSANRMS